MQPSSRVGRKAASVSLSELQTLRGDKDFRRVLSEGRRRHLDGLVVVRSPGKPGPSRLGFVVSKRLGNAVERNRIRRRLRHAVKSQDLQPGNDYVIIAKKQIAEASHQMLLDWIAMGVEGVRDDS